MTMKSIHLILLLTAAFPLLADQQTAPVATTATAEPPSAPALPEGEQRLRDGIVILGTLYQCMAGVQNNDTAEAAVPQIMRLRDELQQWVRGFNSLPPLSDPEVQAYEDRYLPTLRKINSLIETQADRLAAAEYYGSKNLAAALVHMAQVGH